MKLFAFAAAVSLAAGSALADQSDRYIDQRLDTSVAQTGASADQGTRVEVISTRDGSATTSKPYAYQSPFGVGPNNDSR